MNIIRILNKFSIGSRIALLTAFSILSIVVLGSTYNSGAQSVGEASLHELEVFELLELSGVVSTNALQLRRREKDFLLRRDLKYVEKYQTDVEALLGATAAMMNSPEADLLAEEVSRIESGIALHRAQFLKVVQLHETLGLDEKSGLQGILRGAVHGVEEKLKEANLDALTVKMLMMRRHEKDFMMRGADKYIGRIADRRQEFDGILETASLPDAFKADVTTLMDGYIAGFNAYSEIGLQLKDETSQLSAVFAEVEPEIKAANEKTSQAYLTAKSDLKANQQFTNLIFYSAAGVIFVFALFAGVLIALSILKPLKNLTATMTDLAVGKDVAEVPFTEFKTEIGTMAKAVLVFKENAIERNSLQSQGEQEQNARESRQLKIEDLISNFRDRSTSILQAAISDMSVMQATAKSLGDAAEMSATRAGETAALSKEATANVQTVASASEELAASVNAISGTVGETTSVVDKATLAAKLSNEKVGSLDLAAQKIGDVVSLIRDIAEQTNLLALNATIEAARAGDSGRGFAVVASEVKALAEQTANATEEIAHQIGAIQSSTKDAVESINTIAETMDEVNKYTTSISTAVQEQGSATSEISRSVQEAFGGTSMVSDNMAEMTAAATQTNRSAEDAQKASENAVSQTEDLRATIDEFLQEVAAA